MAAEVSLLDMLDARERRVHHQQELLEQYHKPLICFTMNIARPIKDSPLIRRGFARGQQLLRQQFFRAKLSPLHTDAHCEATGCEAFYVLDADPMAIKKFTTDIEDATPLGRLFDMDVLRPDGTKVDREELSLSGRRCLICGGPAKVCSSRRIHTVVELQAKTTEILSQIITHLIEIQCARGNLHLFLYTKVKSSKFFGDLGFYEIARVEDTLVFMENRRDGFSSYLRNLEKTKTEGKSAALVMNANPFTLGHQYLVEKAAAACDTLHLFVVSEDASLVPFAVRKKLVAEGVKHLPNVVLHDSGPYIISNATFPSYFLKDEAAVIDGHARLDLAVFTKIAKTLNITARYVGEEPTSQVTGLYNQIMCQQLPKAGIDCIVVPRKEANGKAISASTVRQCLQSGDWDTLETLLPQTSLAYFRSPEAAPVLQRIRKAGNVVHY